MHIPDESHFDLIQNFVSKNIIDQAYKEAIDLGYQWHEYGDVTIFL